MQFHKDVETIINRSAVTVKHSENFDIILYMGHALD